MGKGVVSIPYDLTVYPHLTMLQEYLDVLAPRFTLLLIEHPRFVLHAIGASSRSAGKKYGDVAPWKTKTLPEKIWRSCSEAL